MTVRTTRLLATTTASVALVLGAAQPGSAAPRAEEPAGAVDLPAGVGCDFPLRLESSAGAVRTVTLDLENGSARLISVRTGVVLTYTNLASGESISIKTSGSVTRAVAVDGVTEIRTATGHNGLILFPDDVPAGPSTIQYNGRIVYRFNTVTGFTELISASGKATDICAALA